MWVGLCVLGPVAEEAQGARWAVVSWTHNSLHLRATHSKPGSGASSVPGVLSVPPGQHLATSRPLESLSLGKYWCLCRVCVRVCVCWEPRDVLLGFHLITEESDSAERGQGCCGLAR